MLVRSPRKLVFLAFAAFFFVLLVLRQSPWVDGTALVYEQIPLWHAGEKGGAANQGQDELTSQTGNENGNGNPNVNDIGNTVSEGGKSNADEDKSSSVVDAELSAGGAPSTGVSTVVPEDEEPSKVTPPWVSDSSKGSPLDYTPKPTDLKKYLREMLNWNRPSWNGHWPPFNDYVDKEYDPNRWEQFDM